MIIIGVDYYPSDQYIAFADTETSEFGLPFCRLHIASCADDVSRRPGPASAPRSNGPASS
jgi:hypothetical protein